MRSVGVPHLAALWATLAVSQSICIRLQGTIFQKTVIFLSVKFSISICIKWVGAKAMLSVFIVTMAWRVFRLELEETATDLVT